jgi:hypothetical protein
LREILFGVLNTNLFSENNAKRTCFSSQNENNEKPENSGIFCQIAEFYGWIGGKTSRRPGNSGGFSLQTVSNQIVVPPRKQ